MSFMRQGRNCQSCNRHCNSTQWRDVLTPQGNKSLCQPCADIALRRINGENVVTLFIRSTLGADALKSLLEQKLGELHPTQITIK